MTASARYCPRCGQPLDARPEPARPGRSGQPTPDGGASGDPSPSVAALAGAFADPAAPDAAVSRCVACGYEVYVNPRPTGSTIILDGPRFLALVRARDPGAGGWDIRGGFCGPWEHPAVAAVREAREELGVRVALGEFVGMYVGHYPYQGEDRPVLDCFWLASIVEGTVTPDPDEATGHAWLPLYDPPPLAFATMDSAIRDAAALVRMRGGVL